MVSRVDRVSSSVGGEPLSRSATSFDGIRRCSVVEGGGPFPVIFLRQ